MSESVSTSALNTELVEVGVESYKNLEAVRVAWGPRVALYGANGTGKSNLLEAITLASGSRASVWQLARSAAQPEPGSISMLVRTTGRLLPLPPAQLPSDPRVVRDVDQMTPAGRVAAEQRFWQMLDIERGSTWAEAFWSGAVDARLAGVLATAGERPLIRYRLESIEGLSKAAGMDRGEAIRNEVLDYELEELQELEFTRRFSRTVCLDGPPPDWLVDLSAALPDPFAPLRSWLDQPEGVRSPHADLLALPPTDRIPVQTVWMAAERTSAQAWFDLWSAITRATVSCRGLFGHLCELPVWEGSWAEDGEELYREDLDQRANYWLATRAADAGQHVMEPLFPGFGIYADGPYSGGIGVYSSSYSGKERKRDPKRGPDLLDAFLNETGFLERLSSGERAWLDAALANGAAEVERQGALSQWRANAMARLSENDRLEAAVDALSPRRIDLDPMDGDDLNAVVEQLDRRLIAIDDYLANPEPALDRLEIEPDERAFFEDFRRQLGATAAFSSGVREVREMPLRLTAYDEPERHLHPAAQRRAIAALDQVRDDHVVIATHSHLFLGRPGWRHLHLSRTPEGTVLRQFEVADLNRAATITKELGLERGELLSFVRYVLIVEGNVDRLILQTLYGDLLAGAGVLILPMGGINEVKSLAELTIIGELLDVGVGVLADHTRVEHLAAEKLPRDASKEETALWELRRLLRRKGRQIDLHGLKRVDIIAYINEDTIRARFPDFAGWAEIDRRPGGGSTFKDEFARVTGQPVRYALVKELVETMAAEGRPALDDLPHVVQRIVSRADQTHPADDEDQANS